jgi:hypothetical protein
MGEQILDVAAFLAMSGRVAADLNVAEVYFSSGTDVLNGHYSCTADG